MNDNGAPGTTPAGKENRLLAALPGAAYRRLAARLELVRLGRQEILYQPHQPIGHVYFPLDGVISLLSVMEDGRTAEVATVGKEGMLGLPLFLGNHRGPLQALTQIAGTALRLDAASFRRQCRTGSPFYAVLQRYTHALFTEITQSVACTRLHPVEQRCARCLLITCDRVGTNELRLTQELLGRLLGVRRARVAEVLGVLRRARAVTYGGGRTTVVDRARLEATACECYRIIKDEYDRVLGRDWSTCAVGGPAGHRGHASSAAAPPPGRSPSAP